MTTRIICGDALTELSKLEPCSVNMCCTSPPYWGLRDYGTATWVGGDAACILAGCPQGGTVLDPFGGSGTTGEVAEANGRNSILIELNPEYVKLAERRTAQKGLGI